MPAGDGVALLTEVFGEIAFHLGRGVERHRVEVEKQFGQQADAVALDDGGALEAGLVVGEAFLGPQAGHADIDGGLLRVAVGIEGANFPEPRGGGREKHDVNMVVMFGLL